MRRKGWLKADWGVSEHKRKAHFYTITPEGRQQLDREAIIFQKLVKAIQLVMRTA